MQKVCKSTLKETEEFKSNGLDHMAIEEAIETLFDMSKNIDTIKDDVVQKSRSMEAALVELEKTKMDTNLTAKSASEFTGNAVEKQRELAKLKKALVDRGDLASVKKQELQEELKKWREMLGLELINSLMEALFWCSPPSTGRNQPRNMSVNWRSRGVKPI